MAIEIIQLQESTADLLSRVEVDVFDNPIDADQLAAFIRDPRHLMFLAVDEGTVVGMASAFEYFHPDKSPQLFINEVGVAPGHRRNGIGRRLTEALIEAGRKRGCTYAWLGTSVDNHDGRACFGSVKGGEAPQEFLLYEWSLAEPDPD